MSGSLQGALAAFQRRWRIGLLLAGLFDALFIAGLALFVFGLIDLIGAFSDPTRRLLATAIAVIAGAAGLFALWRALSFLDRRAASEADRALGSKRREILSALELSNTPGEQSALGQWLRQRAIERAATQLAALEAGAAMPKRDLRRAPLRLALLAAVLAFCWIVAPNATTRVGQRLLRPSADLPPYSRLQFAVSPNPAQVLYGGDLLVSAEITGGEITAPVRILTRDPATGRHDDAPAFRESDTRYSQKLEKVSRPVEMAFAVGRARSPWLPVQVSTQPKVQEVIFTIEPPAYTRLPRREFAVGTQPLAVLAGSRITARVASNRPLASGTLEFFQAGAKAAAQQVSAEREGANRLRFTWAAQQGARVGLTVRDVLNTASEVLEFEQKLLPDERPEIILREPVGLVLATPDGELPLEYSASDDLGLSRLALVRRLGGYRERSASDPVDAGSRRQEVRGKLALAPYGLVPGQVIELSAETADTNPTLLGVATSETARVRIISREDYAERLRRQTTLEEFTARYEAIEEALEKSRKALAELEQAAASGDAKKAEEARKKAAEAHQEAGKIFGGIAKDFPIFSLDADLAESAADVMTKLFENAKELEGLAGKSPDEMAAAAPALRERLGQAEERVAEDRKRGERAAKAAAVLDEARRFEELLTLQRDVVKDLNRVIEAVRRGEMTAAQALPEMEQRQKRVAEELKEFEQRLDRALQELPEEFAKLRQGAEEFLKGLRQTPIPPIMEEGAEAAKKADGQKAGARAGEALAYMEALKRKRNSFCKAMDGEQPPEEEWPEDLADTMRQLLDGLCRKRGGEGEGEGEGENEGGEQPGTGRGGHSPSGFSMRGKSRLLPTYGPDRMRLGKRGATGVGHQQGGRGGGNAASEAVQQEKSSSAESRPVGGESVAPEAVPEAYREAVKRYFSPREANANLQPKAP